MPPKQILSVCLIVKNEEALLADCLASIDDVADQLIVLDTGSTDRTLEIAQSFDAEIHHFTWCNDFSAARNESIKYATGDWILWIDADERLTPESIPPLRKLLKPEPKPVIYKIRIKNLKEDGKSFTLSNAHRLFTNYRKIQFSGKIHEQVSPSAKQVGAVERDCNIQLDHLGYSFTGEQKLSKQTRNRTILEDEARTHPQSAYAHLTLAHNYKEAGELEKAEQHYQEAIALKQLDPAMTASLLNACADTLLDMNRGPDAAPLIKRSLQLVRKQNAAHFLHYRIAVAKDAWSEAIEYLKKIQALRSQIEKDGSGISTDIEVSETVIWQTIAELYQRQEKWQDADSAYSKCRSNAEPSTKILRAHFKIKEKLSNWPGALDVLTQLIKVEGERPVYLNAIAAILMRMGEYEAALNTLLHLNKAQPEDSRIRKQIASLYSKLGRNEESKNWL